MKIKVAILEKDQVYLNRIAAVFNTKYKDKIEVYSFTDRDIAMSSLKSSGIDVFVANSEFEIDTVSIPAKCGFAYFVDSADVEYVNEQRAINKFQKVDLIYRSILSIYSEKAGNISGLKLGEDGATVIAFSSVSGGVGASSMSASAALHFAAQNKKTLYLNLEKLGSSDVFFSAEGQFNMSDIILALKSRNTNLPLKLESCVRQDIREVYFYSRSELALDMYELTVEDMIRLISEIRSTCSYDYIILDMDFDIDSESLKVLQQVHAIIWVGDGSEISNSKIGRAYEALSILEQDDDSPLINKISLIYNKFSNKTGNTLGDIGIRNIGGAPKYEHATTAQILGFLSKMAVFDNIFNN